MPPYQVCCSDRVVPGLDTGSQSVWPFCLPAADALETVQRLEPGRLEPRPCAAGGTIRLTGKGRITVLGGEQTRPNIHIQDIIDLSLFLLDPPGDTAVDDAGIDNLCVNEIACMEQEHVSSEAVVILSSDPRSCRVNSDRLLATGFRPQHRVEDAIKEIVGMHRQGALADEDRCYNLKWMQATVLS